MKLQLFFGIFSFVFTYLTLECQSKNFQRNKTAIKLASFGRRGSNSEKLEFQRKRHENTLTDKVFWLPKTKSRKAHETRSKSGPKIFPTNPYKSFKHQALGNGYSPFIPQSSDSLNWANSFRNRDENVKDYTGRRFTYSNENPTRGNGPKYLDINDRKIASSKDKNPINPTGLTSSNAPKPLVVEEIVTNGFKNGFESIKDDTNLKTTYEDENSNGYQSPKSLEVKEKWNPTVINDPKSLKTTYEDENPSSYQSPKSLKTSYENQNPTVINGPRSLKTTYEDENPTGHDGPKSLEVKRKWINDFKTSFEDAKDDTRLNTTYEHQNPSGHDDPKSLKTTYENQNPTGYHSPKSLEVKEKWNPTVINGPKSLKTTYEDENPSSYQSPKSLELKGKWNPSGHDGPNSLKTTYEDENPSSYQSPKSLEVKAKWIKDFKTNFEEGKDDTRLKTTKDPSIPENPAGLRDPSLLLGLWEETPDVRETQARFQGENGSVIIGQVGSSVNISCQVINRGDHETVSWVRLRDHHLITVGRQTYSTDDRFSIFFNRNSLEWVLHIRYVQLRDAGEYICQLSTHPPMVLVKTLKITEAAARIDGDPEMIVEGGGVVQLNCILSKHSQTPEYVFWYHNGTMINFDTDRQVSVRNTDDGSVLTLRKSSVDDSGNYTCMPANAKQASIALHVISEYEPAAMQISCSLRVSPHLIYLATSATFILMMLL